MSMNQKTIKKLNQLNKDFYRKTADSFSQSRSYFWPGWQKLLPYLNIVSAQKNELNVLDLACGNGRFGLFLAENSPKIKINYHGVDFSRELLSKAEKKLSKTNINFKLKKTDIIEDFHLSRKYDLITAFGLFHHIPSFDLRRKILKILADHLAEDGLVAVTFWQFADKPRFKDKIVNPEKVGIDPGQLESNDYILDWKRGKTAYRCCHCADQPEVEKLTENLDLKMVDNYLADGKTNNLNLYLVLKNV